MDIKLTDKSRIRRLLTAVVILFCSVVMVCLYPYFGIRAEKNDDPYYGWNDFLQSLWTSNYVLYLEGVNHSEGERLSPADLYMPSVEDTVTYNVTLDGNTSQAVAVSTENTSRIEVWKNLVNQEYMDWEDTWDLIRRKIDYQLTDHNTDEIWESSLLEGQKWDNDNYTFLVKISYDEFGNGTIAQVKGSNFQQIRNIMEEYVRGNPMGDYYDSETKYNSSYAFINPRSCTFLYGMTEKQVAEITSSNPYYRSVPYLRSGDVFRMFYVLSVLVAAFAFVLPYLNLGITGKERFSKGYLEAVVIILCVLLSNPLLVDVVADTNGGVWNQTLLEAGFLPAVARFLQVVGNLALWAAVFFLIFWLSCCLKQIFVLGPRQYIRERSACYHIVLYFRGLVQKGIERVYETAAAVDRSDKTNRLMIKILFLNFLVLSLICSLWFLGIMGLVVYSVILYLLLSRYYRDRRQKYSILLKATNAVAEGNLDVNIAEDLGMFEPFKVELQRIQLGFKKAVDEEVKSQRMKTDLISNVSHDLKTPLTAIITYVNLLKDESITVEQRRSYVDVLDNKSMRLKVLIEDIFEISKATSQNVTLNLQEIDIVNLMKQVGLELEDKIEESGLDFRWKLPDTKIVLMLDSQKTFRIFENLLLNIIKYALAGTRVYIEIGVEGEEVAVSMKNISAVELTADPNDMTERFARGDQSRNTEGSGLGLAIVKSFVELQKGKLYLETEADLFKATIRWKVT